MTEQRPSYYLHYSNALTYGSLLAGLTAVLASSWHLSGGLLALCALLDTFDGRFARMFRRSDEQSKFGVELDSLADAVVFGFVPIACIYPLLDFGGSLVGQVLWLAAATVYLVSALTRLGCYNLNQSKADHFLGMPTTLVALLLAALFLASPGVALSGFALVAGAVAMLAPIPIPRPRGVGMAAFVALILLILLLHSIEAIR
jgi:CDP-diacylglycerol--serine O-phosphatidyltransferase